jgi:hypothetical protein
MGWVFVNENYQSTTLSQDTVSIGTDLVMVWHCPQTSVSNASLSFSGQLFLLGTHKVGYYMLSNLEALGFSSVSLLPFQWQAFR